MIAHSKLSCLLKLSRFEFVTAENFELFLSNSLLAGGLHDEVLRNTLKNNGKMESMQLSR